MVDFFIFLQIFLYAVDHRRELKLELIRESEQLFSERIPRLVQSPKISEKAPRNSVHHLLFIQIHRVFANVFNHRIEVPQIVKIFEISLLFQEFFIIVVALHNFFKVPSQVLVFIVHFLLNALRCFH